MTDTQKLLRGLLQGAPSLRLRILTVLGKCEAPPADAGAGELVDTVARFTNDPDPAVRHAARETLGRLKSYLPGDAGADPAAPAPPVTGPGEGIRERLTHPDHHVRVRAAREIERAGDRAWLPALKERLAVEPHEFVLATLAKAIGRLGGPAEIEALRPHLGSADARVRANTVEGLAFIGVASVAALVAPLVDDPDNRVAGNAAVALALFDHGAALAAAGRMLVSADQAMRESAVHVLREIGGPAAFDRLATGVAPSDPAALRHRAARALDAIHRSLDPPEREGRDAALCLALDRLSAGGSAEPGADPTELATIYENLEHWDDAIREYKRALAERPGNWPIIKRVRECARKRDGK